MTPLVTVGICARNAEGSIAKAVDSIPAQDFPHELIELVVVDDGSEDSTLAVVCEHVSGIDIPVKVLHQEWKGLGPVRNAVVENARGRYIVWVDSDMILPPNFVGRQVEFMEQNRQVGVARGKYVFRPDSPVSTLKRMEYVVAYSKYGGQSTEKMPGIGGTICRTKALEQVGGFDNSLRCAGEDVDFIFRIRKAGWHIYFATDSHFFAEQQDSLIGLWKKYSWHGMGAYHIHKKNTNTTNLYRMTPIASFILGLLFVSDAYRATRSLLSLLLPFLLAFQSLAWLSGFVRSQLAG